MGLKITPIRLCILLSVALLALLRQRTWQHVNGNSTHRSHSRVGCFRGEALPALPEMMSALEDENAKVREYAAKNIGLVLIFSQTEGAHPEVIELLRRRLFDVEVKVQKEAIRSLGWMGAVAGIAAPDIVQKLRDCDKDLVREAIDCLGRIGPSAADAADAILGHHVHTR